MLNLYNLKNKTSDQLTNPDKQEIEQNNINKIHSLNSFIDPDQELSSKKLRWGIWFTSNKLFLYKIVKLILLVFIVVIWGFSLYSWAVYLWNIPEQQQVDQKLTSSINYNNVNSHYTAHSLQILGSQVFKSGVDKYDVIADVSNPNEDFIAYFDYYFNISSSSILNKQSTFLLPKQNRPIAHLGVSSESVLNTPALIINNLHWKRISSHKISNPLTWQKYRLNFSLTDFNFMSAYSGDKDKPDANIIQFTLTNNSPFDYYFPEFILSLYQGESFMGVIPFKIDGVFKAMSSSTFDLRSFANGLYADTATVNPLINVYDKSVYYEPAK